MKHAAKYITAIFTAIILCMAYHATAQSMSADELKCRITMIYIGDSTVYSGKNYSPSSQQVMVPGNGERVKIVINSNQNIDNNGQVEYSTRLMNHDGEWSQWSTQREICYANLKKGKYKFQARARKGDELISETIGLELDVQAPFWLTLPGLIIIGVGIVLILTATILIVSNIETRKRHRVQKELDQCTKSLRDATRKINEQLENHNKNIQILSLLSKSGQSIIKNSTLKDIYQTTYQEINKFFETDNIGIGIVNGPHNSIDFSSFIMDGEPMPFARYSLEIVNNMKVYCFLNSKTIVMEDYQKQVSKYIDTANMKVDTLISGSAVFMPLFNDEMAIGVLALFNRNYNFFNSYHLGIIHNIASYLETAILNFSTERKARRRQKILEEQAISLQRTYNNLKKSQAQLQTMSVALTNADNSVVLFDKDGNITWANNGFTKVYGYTLEEYIQGSPHYEQAIRQSDAIEFFKYAFDYKKSVTFSLPHLNKDGKEIWTQSTLTPVFDKNGDLTQIVAVDTDISSLKKAETEITKQRDEIESKSKDLKKSIEYASMIQSALMTGKDNLMKVFKQSFLLNLPKDIVSGDFFWMGEKYGRRYLALCDCAGHGVPGAFVSMMGKVFLDEILMEVRIEHTPAYIIRRLNDKLHESIKSLTDKVGGVDGMDLGLCMINSRNTLLIYAGAFRPLYIVRNGELSTISADRCSVGNIPPENDYQFEDHEITLSEGDLLLMCSDGYADQFGHLNGKKLGRKNFSNLMEQASKLDTAADMENLFYTSHIQWRGNLDQVDDISIMGIRITAEEPDTAVYSYEDDEEE